MYGVSLPCRLFSMHISTITPNGSTYIMYIICTKLPFYFPLALCYTLTILTNFDLMPCGIHHCDVLKFQRTLCLEFMSHVVSSNHGNHCCTLVHAYYDMCLLKSVTVVGPEFLTLSLDEEKRSYIHNNSIRLF